MGPDQLERLGDLIMADPQLRDELAFAEDASAVAESLVAVASGADPPLVILKAEVLSAMEDARKARWAQWV